MMLDWRWLRIALVVSITIVGLTVFTTHPASAATITVTSTADQPPGMADGCTLREAILAANGDAPVNECSAGSGADTIAFNIPGTGRQTIQLSSDLPSITSTVTLDGFTQPGSRPNSQAVGSDAVWNVSIDAHDHGPLSFDGRASTVQGLHITGVFAYSGTGAIILAGSGGHTVRGNHIVRNNAEAISVRSNNNLVGGTQPAARNVIALNASFGADIQFAIDVTGHTNRIQGNYIGTDPSGTDRLANINRVPGDAPYGSGVGLLGDGNLLGGTDAGAGNLIVADGVQVGRTGVENPESDGNVIQGNSIGSNVTGNVLTGGDVRIDQSVNTQVGGTTTAARNLLAAGIRTSSRARDARIEGNAIGTNAAGTAGLGPGVTIQGSTGIIVGGLTSGAGNLIRGGAGAGVSVRDAATGIQILGNSIFSNQGLGIDLGNDGVTPNDDGDGDNGPNHLQNFPSFISAHTHGPASGLTIRFAGVPHRMYHVEAFLNDACDPSGYGEGQTLVLTDNLPTNADGRVGLSWTKYAQDPNHPVLPIGKFVTATLTDTVTGETSEFSPCALVRQGGITTSPATGQTTEAGGTATFTVALNSPTISSVEIAVSVSDPTEATVSPSILAFRPEDGTTPKTVTVTGLDDQEIDGDVTYTVILSPYNSTNEPTDPAFAGFDPHDVTLTNLDNDAGGVIQFATGTIVADESSGAAQVTVTRSGGVAGNVTVDVTTEPGTATPGDDYAGGTYPVTFGDGEASKTVSIPLVNDGITDPDETFAVRLQHPSGGGATLGSPSTATVVIAERGTVDGVIRQVGASGNYFPDDPRAPAGVYRLNVRFQNTGADTFTDLQARITELTGGHTIVNRDGAPTSQPAGVGAVMSVPD
ncbi:MAG: Calx-beta domain-containing protein, partial [Chloroflexota bacterium]